jgi:hypothetical protein
MKFLSYRPVRHAAIWMGAIAVGSCAVATEPTTGAVGSVAVTPSTLTLGIGQQQPVQAVVTDGAGKPMSGAHVVWWSGIPASPAYRHPEW